MTTPMPAARDSPDMIAIGAARRSGHGVATTSTATARTGSPASAHAAPASSEGERHEEDANRSAVRTNGADGACACSTRRTTPA